MTTLLNALNSTVASVSDTATSTALLAANSERKGASIYNDSTEILYVLLGAGTASSSNYSVQIPFEGYFEVPRMGTGGTYAGEINGVWASDASGAARISEYT